jgi:hypothetical protein
MRKASAIPRSRASSLRRFQVELLEARVLLFSGQMPAPVQPISLGVLTPQAVVSYSAPAMPLFAHGVLVAQSLSQAVNNVSTPVFAPLHLAILTAPNGTSTALVVRRVAPFVFSDSGFPPEGSDQAAKPSAGASPFFVAQRGDGSQLDAGEGTVTVSGPIAVSEPVTVSGPITVSGPVMVSGTVGGPGPGFDGRSSSVFDVEQAGIVSAGVGMFISTPPGFGEETSGFVVQGGYHEAYAGTLDATHPWFDAPFPVNSPSESFGFFLRATGESGGIPGFASIRAIGPDGTPLAYAIADYGAGDPPPPMANVSLRGMPLGGRLVVQITSVGTSSTTDTSDTGTTAESAPASGWSVPFVLYVQRPDDQVQGGSSAPPAQLPIAAGTLALTSSGPGVAPSSPEAPATSAATGEGEPALANQDEPPAVIATPDESPADTSGGFNLRVPTGPFVSRSAGPLGPILASVGGDPTPEVDRNERALFQEIDRRDAVDNADRSDQVLELSRGESAGAQSDGSGGRVVAISGSGALPFDVTGLAGRRRTNLSALLASIPTTPGNAEPGDLPAEIAHSMIDPGQLGAIAEASSRAAAPSYSVFIKAACGLAISLGMSSRALFPDLLASVQKRVVPRWLRKRSPGARK